MRNQREKWTEGRPQREPRCSTAGQEHHQASGTDYAYQRASIKLVEKNFEYRFDTEAFVHVLYIIVLNENRTKRYRENISDSVDKASEAK